MESEAKSFLHTFLIVMACLAFYNLIVRNVTPTPIQGWIGI